MRTTLKWGLRGILALALLMVALLLLAYAFFARTIQPMSGEIQIAGLSAPVKVVRDKEGIPHITAKTRDDAFAALGFSHAQDRLWQMEILRMSAQGRLSEMFGSATKDIDIFLRTLGFYDQAKKSLEALTPETIAGLEAYARGVNAFINRKTRMMESQLPPEFVILGHRMEQWKPADSVAALKMMSLDLSKNMKNELARLSFAAEGLSPREIEDLYPLGPLDQPQPMPDLRKLFDLKKPVKEANAAGGNTISPLENRYPNTGIWASNNWVVSGTRTVSGKPLLANDPHLAFGSPSLWYLAHISFEDGGKRRNVIGASLPSTPLILLGRTDNVAWGFTNAGADVQDVFIEQINEDDKSQYRTPSGWQAFETKKETIRIKGGDDVVFSRRKTRHGPVLPGFYKNIEGVLSPNYVAALQWPGFSARDTGMDSAMAIMMADTFEEFVESSKKLLSPMQAIVIADTKGTIGLFAPASVPIRRPENAIEGRAPVPGWDEKYDWVDTIPLEGLPLIRNPPNGAIGTANSRFVGPDYKYLLTYDWEELYRLNRVNKLIVNAREKHSVATMKAAQGDIYSEAFVQLRDLLVARLGRISNDEQKIVGQLMKWDGQMAREKTAPLVMNRWIYHLVQGIYKDDLGASFKIFNQPRATVLVRLFEQGGARNWCDVQGTGRVEQCSEIITNSLTAALAGLRVDYGANPKDWRWGKAHMMYGAHRPFSKVWPLSKLFTVQVPADGGRYTLSRGATDFNNADAPDRAVHGASFRAIYDFSDLNKSIFIQTTGQSGHFLSKLYSNMTKRWSNVEYVPMTTKASDYEAGALGTWNLRPKP